MGDLKGCDICSLYSAQLTPHNVSQAGPDCCGRPWLVFKSEQVRTNQIFHKWIFVEAVSFYLCVLVDLSWLVYGVSWKDCYWACWITLLSHLFMIRESTKLSGIVTEWDAIYWVECILYNFVPPFNTWMLGRKVKNFVFLCQLLCYFSSILLYIFSLNFSFRFF